MNRKRLHISLHIDPAKSLEAISALEGKSQSSIIEAALRAYLRSDDGDRRSNTVTSHLSRLSQQFYQLRADQRILIEAVGLHVQFAMSVAPPLPAALQEGAR